MLSVQSKQLETQLGVRVINPRGIYEPSTYFQASISSGSQIICLAGQVAVAAQGNLVGGKDLAAQMAVVREA